MDKKLETLAKQIMKEAEADGEPVTLEEAVEMAEMELKAKGSGIDKVQTAERKKKAAPPPDPEKVVIIEKLYNFLLTNGENSATIVNVQREISFREYSIQLIKHRPKKEG